MRTRAFTPNAYAASQRGAATTFITVVLLLAVALMALYTNRGAIMEQRLSANEVRAKQALEAANAGIEHALAYLRNGGLDHDSPPDGVVDTITSDTLTNSSNNGQASYYKVVYCDSTTALPACPTTHGAALACTAPANVVQVAVVSCGWSDDDSSVQRVMQVMQATSSIGGTISVPVIARGTTNLLTGGASVFNYFNDLTVWTGGSFLGQSNTGKTFVRDIATNPTASVNDPYRGPSPFGSPGCSSAPTGYTCSTQGSTLGHDVLYGDTNLGSQSLPTYFQGFFAQTPQGYLDNTATYVVDLSPTTTPLSTTLTTVTSTSANLAGLSNQTIWVQGDLTIGGNVTIGTPTAPVILIVNGNLSFTGSPTINGLIFVAGDIDATGGPLIYGAVLGGGQVIGNGNVSVVYDPKVLGAAANLGKAGKVQGSWRDW